MGDDRFDPSTGYLRDGLNLRSAPDVLRSARSSAPSGYAGRAFRRGAVGLGLGSLASGLFGGG